MKRITFYIAVLFLTFVFGVIVTKIYFVSNVQFKVKAVGSLGMCEGGLGGFTAMESYDGEKLSFYHARFTSSEAAQQCFRFKLKHTLRVVESERLYDQTGVNIVGERIVALLPPLETEFVAPTTIISLDGDSIFEIASTSKRHALIYEKRTRRY